MKRRKSPYLQALEGATTATKISKKWNPASATKGKKAQLTLGFFFYIIYNIHHKKKYSDRRGHCPRQSDFKDPSNSSWPVPYDSTCLWP